MELNKVLPKLLDCAAANGDCSRCKRKCWRVVIVVVVIVVRLKIIDRCDNGSEGSLIHRG